jgi:hypothetical protein
MDMAMAATATAIAAINPQSHRFPQDRGMIHSCVHGSATPLS